MLVHGNSNQGLFPFIFTETKEAELSRWEKEGIIKHIQFLRWDILIVPVLNRDGKIRICGDYKTSIDQVSEIESYFYPKSINRFLI